ncbi:MAG: hypothetical protein GY701_13260 [Sulfitobacter sp.]|nr:hypothetical protein [Sulfitobacter sp.]
MRNKPDPREWIEDFTRQQIYVEWLRACGPELDPGDQIRLEFTDINGNAVTAIRRADGWLWRWWRRRNQDRSRFSVGAAVGPLHRGRRTEGEGPILRPDPPDKMIDDITAAYEEGRSDG